MPAVSQPYREPSAQRPSARVRGLSTLLALAFCAWWVAGITAPAQAGEGQWLHLFHVGHDDSSNIVQYDLVVDAECKPLGASPIKVYWRQTKQHKTRSLSMLERRAYAVDGIVREADGVRFHVVARPEQTAHARAAMTDGRCQANAWTSVKGHRAMLTKAWIKTAERDWWRLPKVLFVDLFARGAAGESLFERIIP